jgi:hypothetical protein
MSKDLTEAEYKLLSQTLEAKAEALKRYYGSSFVEAMLRPLPIKASPLPKPNLDIEGLLTKSENNVLTKECVCDIMMLMKQGCACGGV